MNIRYLGHSAFALRHQDTTVLVDPWLTGNPKAPVSADELEADAIVVTHGHGDHVGDAVSISKRTAAPIVAIVELAGELAGAGATTLGPNIGGSARFDWGSVRLTPAWHTSTTDAGLVSTPAGAVVRIGDLTVYHLGDTGLFSDLALPRRREHINVALVPIGGFYTMDRFDAVIATELVGADVVIPCHYGTFPPIDTDADAFKADVEAAGYASVEVLEPGASYEIR
jgi:L-ascorbate metabolism protein UlaG (beta-lactamase superfamily)